MLATAPPRDLGLEPLIEAATDAVPVRGGALPEPLRRRYGGDLAIPLREDRPTVVANFVSTLDGVVSYATPEAAGGGEISGFFEPDRFVMGLLRALADVVLIGAGTLRAAPDERWTPAFIHSPSAADFATLRRRLGLAPQPTTAVVTASGQVDLSHPGLRDPGVPVLVLNGDRGKRMEVGALIDVLAGRGAQLVLCEGGPQLFGQLLGAGIVDELFLTISPQLAGRAADKRRLALVEGIAFSIADAPWSRLVDLRRAGDHLFARYRM